MYKVCSNINSIYEFCFIYTKLTDKFLFRKALREADPIPPNPPTYTTFLPESCIAYGFEEYFHNIYKQLLKAFINQ